MNVVHLLSIRRTAEEQKKKDERKRRGGHAAPCVYLLRGHGRYSFLLTHFHVTANETTQRGKRENEFTPRGTRKRKRRSENLALIRTDCEGKLPVPRIFTPYYENGQTTTEFLKRLCQICRILIVVAYRHERGGGADDDGGGGGRDGGGGSGGGCGDDDGGCKAPL